MGQCANTTRAAGREPQDWLRPFPLSSARSGIPRLAHPTRHQQGFFFLTERNSVGWLGESVDSEEGHLLHLEAQRQPISLRVMACQWLTSCSLHPSHCVCGRGFLLVISTLPTFQMMEDSPYPLRGSYTLRLRWRKCFPHTPCMCAGEACIFFFSFSKFCTFPGHDLPSPRAHSRAVPGHTCCCGGLLPAEGNSLLKLWALFCRQGLNCMVTELYQECIQSDTFSYIKLNLLPTCGYCNKD